jgi:hypothetical protein
MMGGSFASARLRLFLLLICLLTGSACNSMRVYVSNATPPDFTFNAGRFAECCTTFSRFAVYEQGVAEPLWQITAQHGSVERWEANSMLIRYGQTPARFVQNVPSSGDPPPLIEGKIYVATAGDSYYVPPANVKFSISHGKIVTYPVERGRQP